MSIVLLTALIAGYIVYDTSKDVEIEMDMQAMAVSAFSSKATTSQAVLEVAAPNNPETTTLKTTKKLNGNYILSGVNGKNITTDTYTLLVTDTKISGRICNSFFGEYVLKGNVVEASPLASTKMACLGDPGEYENIFFRLISSKPVFENRDEQMTLTAGNTSMVFKHVYE